MIRIPNNICFKELDLSEIFKIGYEYFAECGVYGVVKGLTDRYEISRQQIYNLLHRVVGSLEASVSGPRLDEVKRLSEENKRLDNEVECLRGKVLELEERLSRSVEITEERVNRTILTGIGDIVSQEHIHEILLEAWGEKFVPSESKIQKIGDYYGLVSGLILCDDRVRDRVQQACADEIFFHQTPIGCIVEMETGVIAEIERMGDRTGESWQRLFERFENLEIVVTDLGAGLSKGVSLTSDSPIHMGDMWHLFYKHISSVTQYMERWANGILKEEEDTIALWIYNRKRWSSVEKIQKICNDMLEVMERYYQAIERIVDSFQSITKDYKLTTPESFDVLWNSAIDILSTMDKEPVEKLVSFLKRNKEKYKTVWIFIQKKLSELSVAPNTNSEFTFEELKELAIEEICLRKKSYEESTPENQVEYAKFWKRVIKKLRASITTFYEIWKKIQQLLYSVPRASSLTESFNSLLRSAQQIKRYVSQNFLYLFALKYNMTEHNGHSSPFQRAGIDFGTNDWLELLLNYK